MFSFLRSKPVFSCLFACLCHIPALAGAQIADAEPDLDGSAIIDRYLETQDVRSEMAFIKMVSVAADNSRSEHRFLAVQKQDPDGGRGYLLRLIRPEDVEGVTVLAKEDGDGKVSQWLYLPEIGRSRKLSTEAQNTAFLGSDFSYRDLLREVPMANEYERLDDQFALGERCFVVRAVEKERENQGYAFRDLYISQETSQLLQVDFYDLEGRIIKSLAAYDYDSPRIAGDSTRPQRAVMTTEGANTQTIFTVIEGRINEAIDSNIFDPEFVENWEEDEVDDFIFQLGFTITSSGSE